MDVKASSISDLTYVDALKILSPSEIRVLDLVEKGYSNKEIALDLSLSDLTIKTHRNNICKKLQLSGANSLMKWLLRNKISF